MSDNNQNSLQHSQQENKALKFNMILANATGTTLSALSIVALLGGHTDEGVISAIMATSLLLYGKHAGMAYKLTKKDIERQQRNQHQK